MRGLSKPKTASKSLPVISKICIQAVYNTIRRFMQTAELEPKGAPLLSKTFAVFSLSKSIPNLHMPT